MTIFCQIGMLQDAKSKEHALPKPNSGAGGSPSINKQTLTSSLKTALRDVQNQAQNRIHKPLGSTLLKETGLVADTICGSKRPKPESPASPVCSQSPGNHINGTDSRLVYARRKVELEPEKVSACQSSGSPLLKQRINVKQDQNVLQCQIRQPKFCSFPAFAPFSVTAFPAFSGVSSISQCLGKASSGLKVPELLCTVTTSSTTGTLPLANMQNGNNLDRNERFLQLQMFLKQCDQSNQEEYIKSLRSLSAAARSRHAVELEKRAIRLLLEEGKELHRMRVLNVLGKSIPNSASP